jgi:hypothetical protein
MGKSIALIIGISDYHGGGLEPLPWAQQDADAVEGILRRSDLGGFHVTKLINPNRQVLTEAIENLFAERSRDDTLLFYFSGHGIKDDRGALHLAVPETRRRDNGELSKATALPAAFLHDSMERSLSKRQIVILDSCFSGAFAAGMAAKDGGTIDIAAQLGGDGRAVLTATSSTQYAFGHEERRLSLYTHHLTQGILSGAADLNNDGLISVAELHEYVKEKMRAQPGAMSPMIFTVREGYQIVVCRSPRCDPEARYRNEVEQLARESGGKISATGRALLTSLFGKLNLDPHRARAIETEVLAPYVEHAARVQKLRESVRSAVSSAALEAERPAIERYRQHLGLSSEHLDHLIREAQQEHLGSGLAIDNAVREHRRYLPVIGAGAVGVVIAALLAWSISDSPQKPEIPEVGASIATKRQELTPATAPTAAPRPSSAARPTNPALGRDDYTVRVSADSSRSEAENNARRVVSSAQLHAHERVQIVHQRGLYYVFVGHYPSQSSANADRPRLREILGEGALVEHMSDVCPTWREDEGIRYCDPI